MGRKKKIYTNKVTLAGTSREEISLYNLLRSLLPNKTIIRNDRTILNGKELDIFLPGYKLAFEFNGLYFHNDSMGKDEYYHLYKSIQCEKKGIHLVQIFSDEWESNRAFIVDFIRRILGLNESIESNKLIPSIISKKDAEYFIKVYSLSDRIEQADDYVGLVNNEGTIYSIGSFKNIDTNTSELIQYIEKRNSKVVNGLDSIISFYKKSHNNKIITKVDRRLYRVDEYKKIGFKETQCTEPNIFYTRDYKKRILSENMGRMTEKIALSKGFHKVYDCGFRCFEL